MDPLIAAGVALVTGAGSGIGQRIALAFAERRCTKIFLVDISSGGMERTKELITATNPEAQVICHVANITDESSVQNMVQTCVDKFGRIDFACNNAGLVQSNTLTTDLDMKTFDSLFDVNFKGVYLCHKYQIPVMMKQTPLEVGGVPRRNASRGSIVNTASMCGLAVIGTLAGYNATKHGVVSMTRVDARHYAAEGVRINCVCPGFVDTPMLRRSGLTEEYLAAAKSQAPMNRFVETSEIADGVMFLSGANASAITGISMPIDGGAMLFHVT